MPLGMKLPGIEKLEAQICAIESELRDKLPGEIRKARELGDLRENAEYQSAKERQGLLNAQLANLTGRLAKLRLIDVSRIPQDAAGLGSTVVVYDETQDSEVTYELVTSEESDVPAGRISTTAPIGRALVGKREGDSATARTPRGIRELVVLSLRTFHEKRGA